MDERRSWHARGTLLALVLPSLIAQAPKPAAPRPPLPRLANGARGYEAPPKRHEASKRLIAVGGGWGAEEDKRKLLLQGQTAEDYYRYGLEFKRRLKFAKAIPPLEKAVQLNPRFLAAHKALGEAYAYDGVMADEDGKGEGALLKRYRQSAGAFEQARRLAPKDSALAFNLGILYYNLGEFEKSAEALQAGLHQLPAQKAAKVPLLESGGGRMEVHRILGLALEACGQRERAIAALEAGLAADDPEGYPKGLYEALGPLYLSLGAPDKALAAYRAMLAREEDQRWGTDPDIHLHIAEIQLLRKDAAGAAEAFENAARETTRELQSDERYPPAKDAGAAEVAAWQKRTGETRQALARALYNAGVAHLDAGQQEAAAAAFDRALRVDPSHAEARFNYGLVLHALGKEGEAKAQVRLLSGLDPALAEELHRTLEP